MAIRDLIVRVSATSSDFEKKIASAQRSLASFSDRASALSSVTLTGLSLPIVGFGAAALKAAADFEGLRRGLEAVTGSSAAASAQFERLRKVAELPGLGLEEAVKGATRLQAAGLSANIAERALKSFGNAIAIVGGGREELDGVTRALSQIAAKGKVSAEEINQLAERIPQVRVALKAAFGTASTEDIQKLGISTDAFFERLISQFEKLPSVSGGLKNSFENLRDKVREALANTGSAIAPFASAAIDVLTPLIAKVGEAGRAFAELPQPVQAVTVALLGLAPAVTVLSTVAAKVAELRIMFLGLNAAIVANPIGAAIAAGLIATGAAIAITNGQLDDLTRRYDELGRRKDGLKTLSELTEAAKRGDPDLKAFAAGVGDLGIRLSKASGPSLSFADAMKRLNLSTFPEVRAQAAQAKEALDAVQAAFRRGEATAFDVANATERYNQTLKSLGLISTAVKVSQSELRKEAGGIAEFFEQQRAAIQRAGLEQQFFALMDASKAYRQGILAAIPATTELDAALYGSGKAANAAETALAALNAQVQALAQGKGLDQFFNPGAFEDALAEQVRRARVKPPVIFQGTGERVALDALGSQLDAAKEQFSKLTKEGAKFSRQVSLVVNDTAKNIVDIAKGAKGLGEAFDGIAKGISESFLRYVVEQGINLAIAQVGKLLGKFTDLSSIFGSVGKAGVQTAGQSAQAIGGQSSTAGVSAAVSQGLLGTVGAISQAASAVFEGLQFFQQRRMEQDIGRIEVTSRGALNQLISIQNTLNTYLPLLSSIRPGGGNNVTINVNGGSDPRSTAQETYRLLRLQGVVA